MQHNNARDYTFYSPVHATYSRLDFFLVELWLLEAVTRTNIGIMTFSDHAPVSLQLKTGESQKKSKIWRLNEDLLHEKEIEKRIKEELELYFKTNVAVDRSEAIVWEAHKAYVRGIRIMAGDKIALTKEIAEKQQHKATGDGEVLLKLYGKRKAMRDLVEQETRTLYNLIKKERYIGGNQENFWQRYLKKRKRSIT